MIDESQTAQSQAQQPQIKIGFEASLELLNPEWRTAYSPEQVNQFRFFYQSAMRDLSMFIGATKQTQDNLVQAFQFMDANAVATHNMPAATEVPASDVGIADSGKPKAKPKASAKPAHKAPAKAKPAMKVVTTRKG